MKKLLILLLLIPTLTSAEEFILVCEGEQTTTIDGKNKSTSDEQYIVEINDAYLLVSGAAYKKAQKIENKKGSDSESALDMRYEKTLSLINASADATIFYGTEKCDQKIIIKTKLTIDRTSSNINLSDTREYSDDCKKKYRIENTTFKGKCKKQERAF